MLYKLTSWEEEESWRGWLWDTSVVYWLMAGGLQDPHTPSNVSCPGESNQIISAHSMLHMTMLEETMQVGIELILFAMAALSVLLVVMEGMLSVLMVLSLPQLLPVNTERFGIVDGMLPSMGAI